MAAARDTKRQGRAGARGGRLDTRFDAEELGLVRRAAQRSGLPPSAFVRAAALQAARETWTGAAKSHAIEQPTALAPTASADPAELHQMRVDWTRARANLNQIARNSHLGKVDLGELGPVLGGLRSDVDKVIGLLGGTTSP